MSQSSKESQLQSNNKGYHRLILWQKGREFIKLIYKGTENFPRSEILGLQSQIRRAAISYLLNIVEGHRRKSQKDFLKFLNIAEASLTEVEACLEIALDLEFISEQVYEELESKRKELAIMTRAFVKGVQNS